MEIIGERRPVANRKYKYSFKIGVDKYAPARWKIFDSNDKDFKKVLYENTNGLFCFQSTDIGKEFILKAYVEIYNTQEVYKTKLAILSDQMKILSVEWRDVNNKPINGRTVGYLDDITLAIKTLYIPMGDILEVTIYEDEAIGSPRCMGTYKTTPINKEGYTELHLKKEMLKLYQQRLNNADTFDESEHEYYVQIVYRDHINRVEEGIQLKIKNVLDAFIKPKVAVKPVVVNVPNPPKKNDKKKIDIIFNVFFDGTGNNMNNTTKRINKQTNQQDDSYKNYYSNIALLYMSLDNQEEKNVINVYTEGVGTNNNGADDMISAGLGEGMDINTPAGMIRSNTGISNNIQKAINSMLKSSKNKRFEGRIENVFINLFGFSRGAATARYFMSKEKEIASKLGLGSRYNVYFNFVGLFDTVASYGLYHKNDVKDLKLNIKDKAKKVVHLIASDEFRKNFMLTDITSSIKAGIGYELSLPGVHSDIGGGYQELEKEERFLGKDIDYKNFSEYDLNVLGKLPEKLNKIKQYYIREGWYLEKQFRVTKDINISSKEYLSSKDITFEYTLYGYREISYVYQLIPLKIMVKFCEKYAQGVKFSNEKLEKNSEMLDNFLLNIEKQILEFALKNDTAKSLKFTSLKNEDLRALRNGYLHLSDKRESFAHKGTYNDEGIPMKRLILNDNK